MLTKQTHLPTNEPTLVRDNLHIRTPHNPAHLIRGFNNTRAITLSSNAPCIDVCCEISLHLKEVNHNPRRMSVHVHEIQLPIGTLLQVIRVCQERGFI